MKHSAKVYCSTIIKDLIPKVKAYEDRVVTVASKFGKELKEIEDTAAEIYAPSKKYHDANNTMTFYDSSARKKEEEERQAEEKVLSERRKVYIDSKKETIVPAAREQIRAAQAEFQEEARKVAKDLREHVEKDVSTPLNSAFLHFARVFNEFNIGLTDLDCNALLDFSEDNPTAYRIIESIINKTKSPYNFNYKKTGEFAEEIKYIESLCNDDFFCAPQQVFHEMNELFAGVPIFQEEAETYEEKLKTGFDVKFDSTRLAMCSGQFSGCADRLNEISESWTADPTVEYDHVKAMALEREGLSAGHKATQEALETYMK